MTEHEKKQSGPDSAEGTVTTAPRDPEVEEAYTADIKGAIQNNDHDDAADLFAGSDEVFQYTDKEASIVRWKLDLILLPIMMITYILSFMDKVALSEASIFGIMDDDHLKGQDYSWSSSIFYFGYIAAQYPCSILMQKLPLGRYFGVMITLWGVVTTCMAATTSFGTLATCRFFLGAFETCYSPVLTVLVGQYWTRREQPLRAAIWWAGGGVGGFIADSITYSVSGDTFSSDRYATWQVVFLIFGPICIGWGILVFFCVPSSPMTAWFLSERERKIAVMRVIKNHTGIENRRYKLYQVKEALMDIQAWMLTAIAFLQCIPGGGLTAFDKIVVRGLGYDDRQTVLMAFPEDAVHLMSVIVAGVISQTVPNSRCAMMIVTNIIVLVGSVLVGTLPDSKAHSRLGAFYVIFVNTVSYGMCMSLVASNVGGFTKKATVAVMMFMAYGVGQIIAPHFFIASEAPRYGTGFRSFYISVSLMIVIQIILIHSLYLMYQNRKKERAAASNEAHAGQDALAYDFLDLTDKEHAGFRYLL
ncbi:Pantothenate transporter [Pleurostoma richardsiae]|uniref:Pantothenate transporter n=1 Tax=Pleurostoma richardsiae TaxID=41990 RepID=A0AA38VCF5_9PEZI|nr:Pantothenate transporter [Pleurostoma richardsiae]